MAEPKAILEQLLGRYLSIRSHSEHEIRQYLERKSKKYPVSQEDRETLIAKYKRLGYINDVDFAQSLSHHMVANKAKGKRFLAAKLHQAGVEKVVITQTVSEVDPEEVSASLEKRLSRYTTKLAKYPPKETYARAFRYLLQAGFSSSEIRPFLDEWVKKR